MKKRVISIWNDISDIELEREAPVRLVFPGLRILAVLALFFGGSFFVIPLAYLVKTLAQGEPISGAAPLLVISVLFAPLLVYGINLWMQKKELSITQEEVSQTYRDLFKRSSWTAPVAEYDGVMLMSDIYDDGGDYSAFGYSVMLIHAEAEKSIVLYTCLQHRMAHAAWKRYAAFFRAPLLERLGRGEWLVRDFSDADRSMMELLVARRLHIDMTPGQCPETVQTTREPNSSQIRIDLPDKSVVILDEDYLILRRSGLFGGDFRLDFVDIAAITTENSPGGNRWRMAVIIRDQSASVRHILAHGQPEPVLFWLSRFLLTWIVPRLSPPAR